MSIAVSNVIAVQGTGNYVKESVVEVTYQVSADGTNNGHKFTMSAEFQLTSALPVWTPAYIHSKTVTGEVEHTEINPGTYKLLLRIPATLTQAGIAAPYNNWTSEFKVRLRAKDTTTNDYSDYAETPGAISLKAKQPAVTSARMPQYIGNLGTPSPYDSVPLTLEGNDGATPTAGSPAYWRASTNSADLADGSTLAFVAWSGNKTYRFTANDFDGEKSTLVKVYDPYYNASPAVEFTYDGVMGHRPRLQKSPPTKTALHIIGTTGQEEYTGIDIDRSTGVDEPEPPRQAGRLGRQPGSDDLPHQVERKQHRNDAAYRSDHVPPGRQQHRPRHRLYRRHAVQDLWLTTDPLAPSVNDHDADATVTVAVEVKDAAGNRVNLTETTRLNTRIYTTHHAPLRPEDATYRHKFYEVGASGAVTPIEKTLPLGTDIVRAWPDIFYPPSHGYPVDSFGELKVNDAVAMNGVSNADNDAPAVESIPNSTGKRLVLDEQGRPIMSAWTRDGTKNYSSMLSSHPTNLTYWIIDNQVYGDFQLDFEHFDLNANAYGPPYNALAPYRGDVLVVYDATQAGAERHDRSGHRQQVLHTGRFQQAR